MKRFELIMRAIFFPLAVIFLCFDMLQWFALKSTGRAKDCLIVWLWKRFVTEYDKK